MAVRPEIKIAFLTLIVISYTPIHQLNRIFTKKSKAFFTEEEVFLQNRVNSSILKRED